MSATAGAPAADSPAFCDPVSSEGFTVVFPPFMPIPPENRAGKPPVWLADLLRGLKKEKKGVHIYHAKAFASLRAVQSLDEQEFLSSIAGTYQCVMQQGNTSAKWCRTADGRFVVKVVGDHPLESFQRFATSYFSYVRGDLTMLAKIFGVFRVEMEMEKKAYNLVLTESVSPPGAYDLKGFSRSFPKTDKDFGIAPLTSSSHKKFFATLSKDTAFLKDQGMVDYSLLVWKEDRALRVALIDYITYMPSTKICPPHKYRERMLTKFQEYFPREPDPGKAMSHGDCLETGELDESKVMPGKPLADWQRGTSDLFPVREASSCAEPTSLSNAVRNFSC